MTLARCDLCGGDDVTHLNVAAYVARKTHLRIRDVLIWPCNLVNLFSRQLHALEREAIH